MIPGASEMPPQVPGKSRQVMAQKILQQSREAESALADALVSLPPGGVLVSVSELHLLEFNMKPWCGNFSLLIIRLKNILLISWN